MSLRPISWSFARFQASPRPTSSARSWFTRCSATSSPAGRSFSFGFSMLRRVLLSIAALAVLAPAAWLLLDPPEPTPPAAGIPLALAEERAARISDLEYVVSLSIPASNQDRIKGQVLAKFALSDASRPLYFDFAQPADRLLLAKANGVVIQSKVEA